MEGDECMLEAILSLGLGISAIMFVGFPASYYIWSKKEKNIESFWATSLIGGVSIICLVLKIIFMLNIPIKVYGRYLYVFSGILFLVWLWKKRKDTELITTLVSPQALWMSLMAGGIHAIVYIIYGAKFYKGYALWDIYYYGAQAEAVKSIPFSLWNDLVYSKPWMLGTVSYTSGVHRISCGVLGGYVATLSGVDGCTTMGFLVVLSSIMLYWVLMYATENMFDSKAKQRWGCFFATLIPGIVIAQLECFIPVAFFMSFLIFYCKCFGDFVEKNNVKRFIYLSIVISSSMTMLLDGMYIVIGIIVLCAIWVAHKKRARDGIVAFGKMVGIIASATLLNAPYWPYLVEELHWKMSREHLNGIYGFAYTPQAFDWLFYGDLLWNRSLVIYTILTFIAIILFGYGLFGLVIRTIKDKDKVTCNFIAVFCVSLLFLAQPGEHQYAFYKVLHFSFAPIVIGVFLATRYIVSELKGDKKIFGVYGKILTVSTYAIMGFCCFCSCIKVLGVFKPFESYAGRVVGKETVLSENAKSRFEAIENSEKPLLLVCNDRESELGLWWSFYYGRNQNVYIMSAAEVEHFLLEKDVNKMEYLNVPLDCTIIRIGNQNDKIFPETQSNQENFATVLSKLHENNIKVLADIENYPEESSSLYELNVYARKTANVKIVLEVTSDVETIVKYDGKEKNIGTSIEKLEMNKTLNEGNNYFSFAESTGNLRIISYRVELL